MYESRSGKTMSRLRQKIFYSITGRIVMIFLAILIPIYALLIISAGAYIKSLQDQALANVQSILELELARLDAELSSIDWFYYNVQEENADFQQIMQWDGSTEDKIALYQANWSLVRQERLTSFSEAMFIFVRPEENLLLVDTQFSSLGSTELRSALEDSYYVRNAIKWSVQTISGVPCLLHTTKYSDICYGALVDMQAFMSGIQEKLPYQQMETSLDLYPESGLPPLTAAAQVHGTKRWIFITLDRREVANAMPMVSRIILVFGAVLIIILPVLLIFLFMRMIVKPLRQIEKGMQHFGTGETDYRIPEMHAASEFVSLRTSFNDMAEEIQTLKIRSYEEALERERMQLQNLLLQIRPHFLLNFFNQIYSMAELEEYDGIKKSSLYLSRFFRHLFRSERTTTFKSELEIVSAYLELMEERFTDCFTVERDIDESLLTYRVPPLIVQNFVENIFKYAISDANVVEIRLTLQREEDYVVMTIQDDGPGMEDDMLEMIRQAKPIEKSDGTHIGIYNSAYRLKKLCGEESILEVQSVLTEGTTVKIKLPYTGQEKQH